MGKKRRRTCSCVAAATEMTVFRSQVFRRVVTCFAEVIGHVSVVRRGGRERAFVRDCFASLPLGGLDSRSHLTSQARCPFESMNVANLPVEFVGPAIRPRASIQTIENLQADMPHVCGREPCSSPQARSSSFSQAPRRRRCPSAREPVLAFPPAPHASLFHA